MPIQRPCAQGVRPRNSQRCVGLKTNCGNSTAKAHADILEDITALQNSLTALCDQMGAINNRLTKIERGHTRVPIKPNRAASDEFHQKSTTPYFGNAALGDTSYHGRASSENVTRFDDQPQLRIMAEEETEAEPGPPVPPGEPAIPMNHTNRAGLLLDWPSIRRMIRSHLDHKGIRYISEYPIGIEQARGSLILYGRGEDSLRSCQTREELDHGSFELSDDSSDMASPFPATDYGQIGGLSPSDQIDYRGGALGSDGNPDFSEAKVWSYVESFKENILNMHPIIQPGALDNWVYFFLASLPGQQQKQTKSSASKGSFVVGSTGGDRQVFAEATGSKRKHGSPAPGSSDGPPTPASMKFGKPNRSLHSALILTILALGKISHHRSNIPDPVYQNAEVASQGSPPARNGILGQESPPAYSSTSQSSGRPSPKDQDWGSHSRRSPFNTQSTTSSGFGSKKNHEAIPGLEYFEHASDILGNFTGSYNNMKDVYASIFAGLYLGQLARPLESFAYIQRAGHKLQVIIRPSLDKLSKIKHNNEFIQQKRHNQLSLAFWTCLQLESDLIAELPLPPSGLLAYEDNMPHPNMSLLDGFSQRILDSYLGQLYLRTHLNSIHRIFYSPEDPKDFGEDRFQNVGLVADAVSNMAWVGPSFTFKEDDPPADDILAARLRAKYWGAQVITYRPFIRQILQFNDSLRNNPSSPDVPAKPEFRSGIIAPDILPTAGTASDIDPLVFELAKKGIKALIESTRAFHGLGEQRPLITNVFGTAHA